jgi:hypothetical protein
MQKPEDRYEALKQARKILTAPAAQLFGATVATLGKAGNYSFDLLQIAEYIAGNDKLAAAQPTFDEIISGVPRRGKHAKND